MIRLVAAWYSSNIGVLLLNKYLLSNYGFKYLIFFDHLSHDGLLVAQLHGNRMDKYGAYADNSVLSSDVQFFKIAVQVNGFSG